MFRIAAAKPRYSIVCHVIVLAVLASSAHAQRKLEEVIVTAQKREQSLQDVSVPVTAISFDRIETNQVISLEDLQYIAPSVSFGHSLGFAKIFMRGIGLNDQTAGNDPSVALHVDGAVVNDPTAHFTSLFDLERVEVLRGPQGILYGRNATGGSINLITAKPTREFEGYIRGSYGNYDRILSEGAVSGPLNEWLSGRVAFRWLSRDGYGENEATGNDVDDAEQQAIRMHLQADFNDKVSYLLTGEYYMEDDHSLGLHFKRETFPQFRDPTTIADAQAALAANPALIPAAQRALAPLGLDACCTPIGTGDYPLGERNFASEFDPQNDKTTWAVTGTLSVELSEHFTLKNITNYREVNGFFTHDFDMSGNISRYDINGSAPTIHARTIYSDQFSNELQLHYNSERLNGLVAMYHFKQHTKGINRSGASPFPVGLVPGLSHQRVFLTGYGEADSFSMFGNITYDINDQFSVKAGVRYTKEERTVNTFNLIEVFVNPAFTPNALSTIPHFTLPPIPGVTTLQDTANTDDVSPMAGIEWRPMSNLMAYYTYSEGFKSATGQLGTAGSGIAEPEEIENHEFGIKSSWLDQRLTMNLAVFHYDFDNLQLARTVPAGGGGSGFVNLFENAAKTSGNGVELETYWQVTDQFRLTGALSWLDVEFEEFTTVDNFDPCLILTDLGICTPQVQSFAGNTTRNTPEWAFNIHGEYEFPLQNGGMLTLGADVSHKSKQYFSESNNDVESSDAYTFVDATLTYTAPGENWYVTAWGKNLADELAAAGSFAVSLSRTAGTTFLAPRTYGVTAGYNF